MLGSHWLFLVPGVLYLSLVVGCSSAEVETPAAESVYIACSDPRPEICTREFVPVCASRDTGIRCVTTPCDSSEWVTSSNACTACSDPLVYGHRAGACAEN